MPHYPFPRSLGYLARRTVGASVLLADRVSAAVFPSVPPAAKGPEGWAAGYAAGVLDAFDEPAPALAP